MVDQLQQFTDKVSLNDDFNPFNDLFLVVSLLRPYRCYKILHNLVTRNLLSDDQLAKVPDDWRDKGEISVCSDEIA